MSESSDSAPEPSEIVDGREVIAEIKAYFTKQGETINSEKMKLAYHAALLDPEKVETDPQVAHLHGIIEGRKAALDSLSFFVCEIELRYGLLNPEDIITEGGGW